MLGELDRTAGLIDEHAEVLAALRIRIYGAPRKTLEEVLKAAGDIKGKRSLEDLEAPKTAGILEDAFKVPEKKIRVAVAQAEGPEAKPLSRLSCSPVVLFGRQRVVALPLLDVHPEDRPVVGELQVLGVLALQGVERPVGLGPVGQDRSPGPWRSARRSCSSPRPSARP